MELAEEDLTESLLALLKQGREGRIESNSPVTFWREQNCCISPQVVGYVVPGMSRKMLLTPGNTKPQGVSQEK